jgi:hypothetical protein
MFTSEGAMSSSLRFDDFVLDLVFVEVVAQHGPLVLRAALIRAF